MSTSSPRSSVPCSKPRTWSPRPRARGGVHGLGGRLLGLGAAALRRPRSGVGADPRLRRHVAAAPRSGEPRPRSQLPGFLEPAWAPIPTPPRPSARAAHLLPLGRRHAASPSSPRAPAAPRRCPAIPTRWSSSTTTIWRPRRAELSACWCARATTDSWPDATAVAARRARATSTPSSASRPTAPPPPRRRVHPRLSRGHPDRPSRSPSREPPISPLDTRWMVSTRTPTARAPSLTVTRSPPTTRTSPPSSPSASPPTSRPRPSTASPRAGSHVARKRARTSRPRSTRGRQGRDPFKRERHRRRPGVPRRRRLDTSMNFFPLGTQPAFNDTFYLQANDVFSRPGAAVTVNVTASQQQRAPGLNDKAMLAWEVFDGTSWVGRHTAGVLAQERSADRGNPFVTTTFTLPGTVGLATSTASPATGCACASPPATSARARVLQALDTSQIAPSSRTRAATPSTCGRPTAYRRRWSRRSRSRLQYQPQVNLFDTARG